MGTNHIHQWTNALCAPETDGVFYMRWFGVPSICIMGWLVCVFPVAMFICLTAGYLSIVVGFCWYLVSLVGCVLLKARCSKYQATATSHKLNFRQHFFFRRPFRFGDAHRPWPKRSEVSLRSLLCTDQETTIDFLKTKIVTWPEEGVARVWIWPRSGDGLLTCPVQGSQDLRVKPKHLSHCDLNDEFPWFWTRPGSDNWFLETVGGTVVFK